MPIETEDGLQSDTFVNVHNHVLSHAWLRKRLLSKLHIRMAVLGTTGTYAKLCQQSSPGEVEYIEGEEFELHPPLS